MSKILSLAQLAQIAQVTKFTTLAWVVGAGSGGVAPAADADFGAVLHPLVVLVGRKRDWHDVVIDDERALEKKNGDVVDQSSRVVVRVATESVDLNLLSGGLALADVVRAGDGGDAAGVVAVRGGDTLRDEGAERAAAEVRAGSLERENVRLRVLGDDVAADDDGNGRHGGIGGGEDSSCELENKDLFLEKNEKISLVAEKIGFYLLSSCLKRDAGIK